MNKKGFTLIELLAVIVILAIIALIATPAVLNIIEDSRKGAAEASARNIVNAAKTYYMSETMNGRTVGTIDLSGDTLKYDGDQAEKGYVSFTDGKPESEMYIGGYCVTVSIDGKVTSEKKTEDECEAEPIIPAVVYTKYADGTPLLYDPVNNVKCTDSEVSTNVNNYRALNSDSLTGLNHGCMKFYAFLDSEESSTVNLILDHNTSNGALWNVDGGETPDTVLEELAFDTTNWNNAIKSSIRLISAVEVNQIAPIIPYQGTYSYVSEWSQTNTDICYNLHTGTEENYTGAAGSNKYAWLFENTWRCTIWGCNEVDENGSAYLTSSYAANGEAWMVEQTGILCTREITNGGGGGVRPVISVDKSIFK